MWLFSIREWHQSLIKQWSRLLNFHVLIYIFFMQRFKSVKTEPLLFLTIHPLMFLPFCPYSTLHLQVTQCSTVWWLWQDVALWGRSRIQKFSGSRRQISYRWKTIQGTRNGLLRCERFWTQDTSISPGLPLESAWTWVWMHTAGSWKILPITDSFGKIL